MISFFDYLYYSICLVYAAARDKGAISSAAAVIGLFQALNIAALLMLVQLVINKDVFNKPFAIAMVVILQILTYIRYIYKDNHSIEIIEKKWLEEKESSRNRLRILFWIYCIVSVSACVGLAIYLGSRH